MEANCDYCKLEMYIEGLKRFPRQIRQAMGNEMAEDFFDSMSSRHIEAS